LQKFSKNSKATAIFVFADIEGDVTFRQPAVTGKFLCLSPGWGIADFLDILHDSSRKPGLSIGTVPDPGLVNSLDPGS
jgi:hypothetical protein